MKHVRTTPLLPVVLSALVVGCDRRDADEEVDAVQGEEVIEEVDGGDVERAEMDGTDLDAEEEEEVRPAGPGAEFSRFCRSAAWNAELVPAVVGPPGGRYIGFYDSLPAGTLETMKVIPEHPMQVTAIRVAFGGVGSGEAKIRLMRSFGRSYPMSYPDLDTEGANLIDPIQISVEYPNANEYIDLDISEQMVFLLPTEHYILVYEHLSEAPYLAVEEVGEGDYSRALILIPGESMPYGMDGNYRLHLVGNYFCSWSQEERWFLEDFTQPMRGEASSRAAFADINNDGNDDLVLNTGRPLAYLGDGAGGFHPSPYDPFPDVPRASMLLFADVDNDGDTDAFAATYVSADGDGDGVWVTAGDCNDADDAINPTAAEIPGNGIDDNCDGLTDDGIGTADGDGDGISIAAGDCDDTRAVVKPGAAEALDGMDNDCDGMAEEDFTHRLLLGDGTGRFSALPSSGVEVIEPTAAAAFGDGDGDGNLDIYWGNWLVHYPRPPAVADRYVKGAGDGTFTDATAAAGMIPDGGPAACYGVLWNDYNNDGWLDVWVGNYGYGWNFMWRNVGGVFEEVGSEIGIARDSVGLYGGNTFGGDFGDFDNDGDLDLYTANISHPRYQPWSDPSLMLVNQGPPDFVFEDRTAELGLIYDEGDVNAAFADFDNDMDLDLVVASLYRGHFSRLYRNDGAAGFTDVSYESGTAVNDAVSAVWSDVDKDGDLDLVIADRAGPDHVHLFINRVGQNSNWLELLLEGVTSNRDAIGARVTLTAGGVTQMREVKGGGGHSNTQSTLVVHFGLASETAIDSVTVRWPGGATEEISGLFPNRRYLVVEGSGTGVPLP